MAEQLQLLTLPEQYPPACVQCPRCKAPIAFLRAIGDSIVPVNYDRVTGGDINWSKQRHGRHVCRAPRRKVPCDDFLRASFRICNGREPTDEELAVARAAYL